MLHIVIYLLDVYEIQLNYYLETVKLVIDICMLEEIFKWRQVMVRKKKEEKKVIAF